MLRDRAPRLAALAALALVLGSTPARASDPASPAPSPATPPASAEQLAEQAYDLHVAGKDADAIATYLRAYELSHASAILFNVATIYDRKLGERGLAEDYFRRYLAAADAEPELVKKATERLTALKKEDEEQAAKRQAIEVAPVPTAPPPAVATPPQPPPPASADSPAATEATPPPPADHTLRNAGLVVGAFGVAGVGASLVLGVVAKGKNDDANAVCNGSACSSANGVTLASQAGSFATASTVAFVSGLALVGGGVAMILLAPKDARRGSAARLRISPQVGTSNVGVTVGGTF